LINSPMAFLREFSDLIVPAPAGSEDSGERYRCRSIRRNAESSIKNLRSDSRKVTPHSWAIKPVFSENALVESALRSADHAPRCLVIRQTTVGSGQDIKISVDFVRSLA